LTRSTRLAAAFAWVVLVLAVVPPVAARADSIRDREWIVAALDLSAAHTYSVGKGVVVAVIDTGVDPSHGDLTGNVLSGRDFDTAGVPSGTGHDDRTGHGTGMSGLIAGHGHGTRGADGVLGVAPAAKILPLKSGDFLGTGIVEALRYATQRHVGVICLAQAENSGDSNLSEAIAAAVRANIVVVAAAGNLPNQTAVGYPAAYPGVVAVAGTDEQGNHAAISASGAQVALAAPATDIVQPYPGHKYQVGTGTSPSAAIVAGAAALVRSRYPKLSAAEVVHRLEATATDKGAPGRDTEYGYGLINIAAALTATVRPAVSNTPSTSPPTSASPIATATSAPPPAGAVPKSGSSTAVGLVAGVAALAAVLLVWVVARLVRRAAPPG
jgi:subtilisin family serine protease